MRTTVVAAVDPRLPADVRARTAGALASVQTRNSNINIVEVHWNLAYRAPLSSAATAAVAAARNSTETRLVMVLVSDSAAFSGWADLAGLAPDPFSSAFTAVPALSATSSTSASGTASSQSAHLASMLHRIVDRFAYGSEGPSADTHNLAHYFNVVSPMWVSNLAISSNIPDPRLYRINQGTTYFAGMIVAPLALKGDNVQRLRIAVEEHGGQFTTLPGVEDEDEDEAPAENEKNEHKSEHAGKVSALSTFTDTTHVVTELPRCATLDVLEQIHIDYICNLLLEPGWMRMPKFIHHTYFTDCLKLGTRLDPTFYEIKIPQRIRIEIMERIKLDVEKARTMVDMDPESESDDDSHESGSEESDDDEFRLGDENIDTTKITKKSLTHKSNDDVFDISSAFTHNSPRSLRKPKKLAGAVGTPKGKGLLRSKLTPRAGNKLRAPGSDGKLLIKSKRRNRSDSTSNIDDELNPDSFNTSATMEQIAEIRELSMDIDMEDEITKTMCLNDTSKFLMGHCFYFTDDNNKLSKRIKDKIVQKLEEYGASIVTNYRMPQITCYVMENMNSTVYVHAEKNQKLCGNIEWVKAILQSKYLVHPRSSVLHYPPPAITIPQFMDVTTCILGYSKQAAVRIGSMIQKMGGKCMLRFEPGKVTHIVSPKIIVKDTDLSKLASVCDIHLINHLWVEDSFLYWSMQKEGKQRYNYYPEDCPEEFRNSFLKYQTSFEIEDDVENDTKSAEDLKNESSASSTVQLGSDSTSENAQQVKNNVGIALEAAIGRTSISNDILLSKLRALDKGISNTTMGVNRVADLRKFFGESIYSISVSHDTVASKKDESFLNRSNNYDKYRNGSRISSDTVETSLPPKLELKKRERSISPQRNVSSPCTPTTMNTNALKLAPPSSITTLSSSPSTVARKLNPPKSTTSHIDATPIIHPPTKSAKVDESFIELDVDSGDENVGYENSPMLRPVKQELEPTQQLTTARSSSIQRPSLLKPPSSAKLETVHMSDDGRSDEKRQSSTVEIIPPARIKPPSGSDKHVSHISGLAAMKMKNKQYSAESSSRSKDSHSNTPLADRNAGSMSKSVSRTSMSSQHRTGKSIPLRGGGVKVLFTGMRPNAEHMKIILDSGIEVVDTPYECTHLITVSISRTEKFLLSLALGKWIVEPVWLDECIESNTVVEAKDYVIRDKKTESAYEFSMPRTILKVHYGKSKLGMNSGVLSNTIIWPQSQVYPGDSTLKNLIMASGGLHIPRVVPAALITFYLEKLIDVGFERAVIDTIDYGRNLGLLDPSESYPILRDPYEKVRRLQGYDSDQKRAKRILSRPIKDAVSILRTHGNFDGRFLDGMGITLLLLKPKPGKDKNGKRTDRNHVENVSDEIHMDLSESMVPKRTIDDLRGLSYEGAINKENFSGTPSTKKKDIIAATDEELGRVGQIPMFANIAEHDSEALLTSLLTFKRVF